ncbi:hypothetical protein AB0B56_31505 [Streptosporangium canum]|uniref:hypothetical protein n=1 Tax=Streptosporangium canum TaxID=324952 RepID=UPI003444ADDE
MNARPASERLAFADADTRLDGALSACFQGDYDTALVFDGDVVRDGDLLEAATPIGAGGEGLGCPLEKQVNRQQVGRAQRWARNDCHICPGLRLFLYMN